ncbi:ABC transporter A family member 11-like [Rhipicephalus microplus]|uniref:ABC transporter A family member 11-like n=1 Tax=Rhipicephalus microplus TaxID=6941 RepID=UPI003F6B1F6A
MVQGTMVCLGTLQHLKDKFGKGCNIKFLLGDALNIQSQEIIEAVGKVFPGMKVLNKTQEQIQIRTREKLPWSIIFRKLETLEKVIGFERVLASDTTLEQLFIEFAEKGQNETDSAWSRSSLASPSSTIVSAASQ